MSKQPPPAPTASAVGPCPTVIQIVGALLINVLTVIGILSLTLQKNSVDLSHVRHSLESTNSTLETMKIGSDKVNAVVQALGYVPAAAVKNNYNGIDISENG